MDEKQPTSDREPRAPEPQVPSQERPRVQILPVPSKVGEGRDNLRHREEWFRRH
jgi:hypothetical protein